MRLRIEAVGARHQRQHRIEQGVVAQRRAGLAGVRPAVAAAWLAHAPPGRRRWSACGRSARGRSSGARVVRAGAAVEGDHQRVRLGRPVAGGHDGDQRAARPATSIAAGAAAGAGRPQPWASSSGARSGGAGAVAPAHEQRQRQRERHDGASAGRAAAAERLASCDLTQRFPPSPLAPAPTRRCGRWFRGAPATKRGAARAVKPPRSRARGRSAARKGASWRRKNSSSCGGATAVPASMAWTWPR